MVSDIALFFNPLAVNDAASYGEGTLGNRVVKYESQDNFPVIEKGSVAIFGVVDCRRSDSVDMTVSDLEKVRNELYSLQDHFGHLKVYDLGNIEAGETVEDTYYAVTNSVASIVKQGCVAILLGGGQDLTYANYLAYQELEQVVNLVCVDSRFDLGGAGDEIRTDRFLQKIILHQPNILFNFSNVGYQTHHVKSEEVDLMKKMYFDTYRLGEVNSELSLVEPVIRNADLVSFDLSSIRTSDFPSNFRSEPNGLYGEQACAISRYAGISDKTSSIGFYNYSSAGDADNQSLKLYSQVIWYFLWGVSNRKGDYPFADKNEYTKYTVTLREGKYEVVFYKSSRSDRWWMEVPYPSKRGQKYERHFMVPCDYSDYLQACEDDVPNRWWQTFQKLG